MVIYVNHYLTISLCVFIHCLVVYLRDEICSSPLVNMSLTVSFNVITYKHTDSY
jgi:hypothetical protein